MESWKDGETVEKPTAEILERIGGNSSQHPEGVYTRLYRYLLREDVYYDAYRKLYSNKGAATRGTDDDTADGFGEKYVRQLIDDLKNGTYIPKPVRREYIRKSNGKMRPLGIPSFRDKLLQEVIRRFLEAIYEPRFNDCSHGFRPNRSCHTALTQIRCYFSGAKWFIEGDIKSCFDDIDHTKLIAILERKIKDSRFVNIIRSFLKAGYIEDWKYVGTFSGTPQGGILSPILANIYLNELDAKVKELKEKFDRKRERALETEYGKITARIRRMEVKAKEAQGETKSAIIRDIAALKKERLNHPCYDDSDRNIAYIRYADDFLMAVKGGRDDCSAIKTELAEFLREELNLTLSEEKTHITHSSEKVRFLGYDISVRRNQSLRTDRMGRKKRWLNGRVELAIPLDKVERFMFEKGAVTQTVKGQLKPTHRKGWLYLPDHEILERYNSEIRGILNYYQLAANYYKLAYFCYLMEYSCLATLAGKYATSIRGIRNKYASQSEWAIQYMTTGGRAKEKRIVKPVDCKRSGVCNDVIPTVTRRPIRNTLRERLLARKCELCGKSDNSLYEVHHIKSLKSLSGDSCWERVMLNKRRITLIVCEDCHANIHAS